MNETLFRKKSIDRVSSPEQLNDYIRVASPSVWMVLLSIIVLLVGVCVWGVFGHLDTTLDTVAITQDGTTYVYIREADAPSVAAGMSVAIGETEVTLGELSVEPEPVGASFSDYALHVGNLQQGEWVYSAPVSGAFSEGVHSAQIIVERVAPMSFVLN